jgi:hemoglobin/transferrin/lactoferrin receptor protein
MQSSSTALTLELVPPSAGLALLLSLLTSTEISALTGVVLDRRTQAPIPNAEVTIAGQRGSVRTGIDGTFDWAIAVRFPIVITVILPDGRVARPVRLEAADVTGRVSVLVESVLVESVQVVGTAPAIDAAAGAATSLVTGADVRMRSPATLGQSLENVPGVSLISEGQSATPAIRGLARGRTTILVDGSRATTERRAGPNGAFVDPAIVERVEVARGPASVAYGSDAMGGVIAVVTRRPDYDRALRVRFSGTLGSFDDGRGELEMSTGYGTGGLLVGVRARTIGSYHSPDGPVANSDWHDRGLRLRWDHETGSGRWSVGWTTDLARAIGRPRSDADIVRVTTPLEDTHRLTVSYERSAFAGFRRVRVAALVGATRQQTDQDRLATPDRTRSLEQSRVGSRELQLRITGDRTLGPIRFQSGADLDARYGLQATDTVLAFTRTGVVASSQITPSIENAHRTNAGLFAQADVPATRHVRLSGGVRGDVVASTNTGGYFGDRSVTRGALAGSGAVTFRLTAPFTVTTQLARGFREPMLSDRFYRGPVGRGVIEGNPDLAPETSWQVDVLAQYATPRLTLAAATYDYRIGNLIERYQVGTSVFRFRNRGEARLRGVELEVHSALPHGFSLGVSAQALRGRGDGRTPLDDIAPASVLAIGRHRVRVLSSYFRVGLVSRHTAAGPSEVPTPGYTLIDAGATWYVGRKLQVVGTLRNLLDERYFANAGPRWVYAPGVQGSVAIAVEF